MLRDSTTGQGLTGKIHSDFTGKYNIAGGAEVTLSFSSGTAGDAYSSGKIAPLGLGKYAWHVPNAVFASLGNVSAVLAVTGGIDVHFEWMVVADSRDLSTKPVNLTQIGGVAQSATDLKDFADTGYDPATHKVQGVVLVDTATTLTNLPAITTNWLTAAGIATDAITEIQNGLATAANLALIPIDGTLTVTLANGVTHGGSTAMLRLGSSTTTPAFYVVNSSSDDNAHAVYFKAGSSMTGGAGLLIDGGSLQTMFIAPAVEGLYAGGDSLAHEGEITDIQSRLPAALESGRMPAALNTAGNEAVADTVLSRNVSNVEATAGEHTLATAILGMLEWEISGNDLIIKRTDGTTVHYTKTLSSATGTGDVITGLN